jgi:uncharacterized membrane protein YfcA
MSIGEIIALFVASAIGGALNAVVGGGSFVTFPALIFAGVSPITANATSTMALFPGTIASSVAYRRNMAEPEPRRLLLWFVGASVLGAVMGATLLLSTSTSTFAHLVPWLLLFATVVFTFGRNLARWLRAHTEGGANLTLAAGVLLQFLIGIYGGYFGGGLGIMMLALLSVIGLSNVHTMNGLRTLLGAIINGVAVVAFIIARAIAWEPALVMVVAAVVAGYLAASMMKRFDPDRARKYIVLLAWGMTAYFLAKEYWGQL